MNVEISKITFDDGITYVIKSDNNLRKLKFFK